MREHEWQSCNRPRPMRAYLARRGLDSDRKLRLYACACCRRVGHLLQDERSHRAVEVAERFADGLADAAELEAARSEAYRAETGWRGHRPSGPMAQRAVQLAREAAFWAASDRPGDADQVAGRAVAMEQAAAFEGKAGLTLRTSWRSSLTVLPPELIPAAWQALAVPAWRAVAAEQADARAARAAGLAEERLAQSRLLREVFGNPFAPPRVDPSWLGWNRGTVIRLARAIYDGCRFADLAVLADALEEAGCDDSVILGHCRSGGEHARGCWVLDALLDQHPWP
jgi:hypothetical protein